MNFIKIDINNFESIYVRESSISMIRKEKYVDHDIREHYRVVLTLSTEKVVILDETTSDAADKFIYGLLTTLRDNHESSHDFPSYMPYNGWPNQVEEVNGNSLCCMGT